MSQPTISDLHIAFIYAEDLWVTNRDGSHPRRLTVDEGIESSPIFSPDGSQIAFSAQYDGNTDVFTIPVEGGVPTRLTWHPTADIVRDFSPDGKNILFASRRNTFINHYAQLFTVSTEGGFPVQLKIPNAWEASYSPDGKHIAYTPIPPRNTQWKNYRGGTITTIFVYNIKNHSVVVIPKPAGGSNDTEPVWIGNKVYFTSDRDGEINLYSFDTSNKTVQTHSSYNDFPILNMQSDGKSVIYEQAGYLHHFDPSNSQSQKITIGIAADLQEMRDRFISGPQYIRSASISPSGSRVAFDFRGEIITAPAEKGDPRNLTNTPGVHEKYPAWSPDGKSIAYFSDASGEYQLHIKSQDGKGDAIAHGLNGAGFYFDLRWSPDGEKLSFVDNGRSLYVLKTADGSIEKVDADDMYFPGPSRDLFGDWSADSKWITYSKITDTQFERIYVYSLDQKKSFPMSDGMSNATSPAFDPSGKYLYFAASTDAGPVVNWFAQSNNDMSLTNSIYLIALQNDILSPLAKESDEEVSSDKTEDKSESKEDEEEKEFYIDFDKIENRIISLPIPPGNYSQLSSVKSGELLYISNGATFSAPSKLHKYDLNARKDDEIMTAGGYEISADGKKMLYIAGKNWGITATGEKPAPGKGIINTGALQVKMNPASEWENAFNEAWRINRDYFYDPGMHGADWDAMKIKYKPFLADLTGRNDLNRIIVWMCSEIGVGHHRLQGGGDQFDVPQRINGGLLGANYEIKNNRYRISKIFGGLNWNPNLRSPLTEPGINAQVGDYILAVNGIDLQASSNIFSLFENTSGKITELTIGSKPNHNDTRVVKVVPIGNESGLRNRDWIEGNMKRVHEATDGQVAYVFVPNTGGGGHQSFKRYFFPQADKKAIILDERFNNGGQIPDYYIDIMQRPYQAHWNFRYGNDLKTPSASIQGPKVMLINESSSSGGDMLAYMFGKFKVGTMVGKRTWGGLVGVLGYPEFIDGGSVTAPNVAIWDEKDGYIVENVGVKPDVEVEQWPAELINGKDPQLEKAIEIALQQLKANPPKEPVRPPYPIRVKKN